jgi:hypothetical protein
VNIEIERWDIEKIELVKRRWIGKIRVDRGKYIIMFGTRRGSVVFIHDSEGASV